ncbi:MAG: helix-turn-helix domain-containing protein [Bacteroidaceae bacterium]|nr:helix-turn-helix domain-containing protein [Bacteroidaceae bacterium]
MKLGKRSLTGLIICLLACMGMKAEDWQRWTTHQGLTSNQTRQVIALPNGQIMAVVEGMIDLYDGEQFRPLELNRTLTADIHSFLNANHYFDQQGRLWIRTLHQLIAIDAHTLRPLNVRQILAESGIRGPLQNFFIDADGMAWLHVGEDSLMQCDWTGPARLVMRIKERNSDGMVAQVCNLTKTGGHHYVLLSTGSMLCLDARSGKALYSTRMGNEGNGFLLMSWNTGPNQLLIGLREGEDNKLVVFDTRKRRISRVLVNERIYDACVDRKGNIWASGARTIYQFNPQLQLCKTLRDLPHDIQSFTIDHQGGIWACTTSQGLLYHSGVHPRLTHTALPGHTSADALLVRPDGQVLAGTSNGIFVHRSGQEGWQPIDELKSLKVVSLSKASDNHTYVSTMNRGLVELDSANHICWHIDETVNPQLRNRVEFALPLSGRRCMANVRMNQLLVIDPSSDKAFNLMKHLGNAMQTYRRIIDALPMDDGWLMATQNGLFFLKRQGTSAYAIDTQRFATLADNPWSVKCNCLFKAQDGSILVATQNGLLRYQESTGKLQRYTTREGLAHNTVLSITDDREGRLWMSTMQGLVRLNLQTDEAIAFGISDGVGDHEFVERAAVRTPEGKLHFGTRNGIYTIDPDSMELPHLKLRPQLLAMHIVGDEDFVTGVDDITLSHKQNFITFTLSTLNYAYASHTRFRYQLQGIDPEWTTVTDQGDKLELSYTALPPGHYRLGVCASMQGDSWGEPLFIDVTIRPPLWRTWWACLLYLLALGTLVRLIWHTVSQQRIMRQRISELLRERERAQVSAQTAQEADAAEPEGDEEPEQAVPQQREISPADRRFLEKALNCVDRNMANSEYSIDHLASDLAMERSTLYRRLQAVMGQAPLEFVRTIRLKRAAELLRSGRYTVTEVSEMVGYNTPRYFTKHFREMYGVRPSEYR